MLVGSADDNGVFHPDDSSLFNLYSLVDVRKATASVESDRIRIMDDLDTSCGFDTANTIARGAIVGANELSMSRSDVLAAACGFPRALEKTLQEGATMDGEQLDDFQTKRVLMYAACSGGYDSVVRTLIERGCDLSDHCAHALELQNAICGSRMPSSGDRRSARCGERRALLDSRAAHRLRQSPGRHSSE